MDVNVVIEARKGDREAFGRLMADIRPALMAQAVSYTHLTLPTKA